MAAYLEDAAFEAMSRLRLDGFFECLIGVIRMVPSICASMAGRGMMTIFSIARQPTRAAKRVLAHELTCV